MPLRRHGCMARAGLRRRFPAHPYPWRSKQEQKAAGKTDGDSKKHPARSRLRNQDAGQRVPDEDATLQSSLRKPCRRSGIEHSRDGQLPHQGLDALLTDETDEGQTCRDGNQSDQTRCIQCHARKARRNAADHSGPDDHAQRMLFDPPAHGFEQDFRQKWHRIHDEQDDADEDRRLAHARTGPQKRHGNHALADHGQGNQGHESRQRSLVHPDHHAISHMAPVRSSSRILSMSASMTPGSSSDSSTRAGQVTRSTVFGMASPGAVKHFKRTNEVRDRIFPIPGAATNVPARSEIRNAIDEVFFRMIWPVAPADAPGMYESMMASMNEGAKLASITDAPMPPWARAAISTSSGPLAVSMTSMWTGPTRTPTALVTASQSLSILRSTAGSLGARKAILSYTIAPFRLILRYLPTAKMVSTWFETTPSTVYSSPAMKAWIRTLRVFCPYLSGLSRIADACCESASRVWQTRPRSPPELASGLTTTGYPVPSPQAMQPDTERQHAWRHPAMPASAPACAMAVLFRRRAVVSGSLPANPSRAASSSARHTPLSAPGMMAS